MLLECCFKILKLGFNDFAAHLEWDRDCLVQLLTMWAPNIVMKADAKRTWYYFLGPTFIGNVCMYVFI